MKASPENLILNTLNRKELSRTAIFYQERGKTMLRTILLLSLSNAWSLRDLA